MADVFDEIRDDIQREKLRQLWEENGVWIIGSAVFAVLLTGALSFWRHWDDRQDQRKTEKLYQLVTLSDAPKLEQFGKTGPADQGMIALFVVAGEHLKKKEKAEAVKIYQEIADMSGVDRRWRDLAKVLGIAQELEEGDPKALEKELKKLSGDGDVWRYTARELLALLAARQGDVQKAVDLFAKIAADPVAPADARQRAFTLRELYAADLVSDESKK